MHRRSRPGNPHLRPFPATLRLLVPRPRFENRGGRMAPQRPLRGAGSRCPQGHREVCRRRAVAFGTPRCQASSAGWRRCRKARSAVLGAPTAAKATATERAAGVRGARARGRDDGSPDPGHRAPRTSHGAASVCGGTSWAGAGSRPASAWLPTRVHTAGRGCTGVSPRESGLGTSESPRQENISVPGKVWHRHGNFR